MAREFAKAFYNSRAWQECRAAYIKMVFGICERCGEPGEIVHHKCKITPDNINDPSVTLSMDNLELLCQRCHNRDEYGEHRDKSRETRYRVDGEGRVLPPSRDG